MHQPNDPERPDGAIVARAWSGYDAVRTLLGALLVLAGILKGPEALAAGGLHVIDWPLLGLAVAEMSFGAWLLTGLCPKATRRLALACFSTFACVSLAKALAGETSCSCFGSIRTAPWFTFALDLAAVAALAWLRPPDSRAAATRVELLRSAGIILLALVGVFPQAFGALGIRAGGHPVVLEPADWIGASLPLLDEIDIADQLTIGRWTVALYHHDCPACREAIPAYERRARASAAQPDAPRIALIEMPPYAPPGSELVAADSPCVRGRLSEAREWLIATPAEISLVDSIVVPRPEDRPVAP